MTIKEIETRTAEIRDLMSSEDADLKSLIEEAKELKTRKAEIIAEQKAEELKVETRKMEMAEVISGKGETVERAIEMEKVEVRNTNEYIDAYAEYVKTGSDTECRALLTTNASGDVAIPSLVYDIVKTAWDKEGLMSRVKKAYLKGILQVGFEISGDDAVVHTEGDNAPNEESLVLGITSLVPASIKKWINCKVA